MKKTKKLLTTMGIVGACAGVGVGTYIMMQNKKKLYKQLMTYHHE